MQQWLVRDVMTTKVVTAATDTTIEQVAGLLTTHRISAVPIVAADDRILGVVSEADLLSTVAATGPPAERGRWRRRRTARASATSAGAVMSTRPVTVPADATLPAAARKMRDSKVKRLLVTGDDGRLLGVVSRADVLRPLTRPDAAIRADIVERVLRRRLWIDPARVRVDVRGGVVTLTGTVGRRTTAGIASRLTGQVPGVVAVVDRVRFDFDDTALARSRVGRTHPFSAEPFHPEGPARSGRDHA